MNTKKRFPSSFFMSKNGETIRNDRFLGIPVESEQFKAVHEPGQLPKQILDQLQRFFINYNKEAGKKFKVLEIVGSQKALKLIKLPKAKSTAGK